MGSIYVNQPAIDILKSRDGVSRSKPPESKGLEHSLPQTISKLNLLKASTEGNDPKEIIQKQPESQSSKPQGPVPTARKTIVSGGDKSSAKVQQIPKPLKFNKEIGLDLFSFLDSVPSLFITQKLNLIEAITSIAEENSFAIIDPEGHCRFVASEISGCCDRFLCGLNRSFRLQIRDVAGNLCLELIRTLDFSCCFGLLLPDSMIVKLPNDQQIGTIKQRFDLAPSYSIKDSKDETQLILQGHKCPCHCPGHDIEFKLLKYMTLHKDGKNLRIKERDGMVIKNWVGFTKELCSEADDFHIQFPKKITAHMKALCLASVFLLVSTTNQN